MKRKESDIIKELQDVECQLSPENVSCDGELTRSQVAKRVRSLNATKARLVAELGRQPTDKEIYG